MLLLILSFTLISLSSYLITSILSKNADEKFPAAIYFVLIYFAHLILTPIFLSFFAQLKPLPYITLNMLTVCVSFLFWFFGGKILYKIQPVNDLLRLRNALNLDKSLYVMLFGWLIFIIICIFTAAFCPVSNYDALSYHLARVAFWISNSSLAHFDTPDLRMTIYPINSELFYTHIILFLKRDIGIGLFSTIGCFMSLYSLNGLLSDIGFSLRKRLWSIFIYSGFAAIVVLSSSSETDLPLGALILTSLFLYNRGIKYHNNTCLYFSALSYAFALGIKSTAFFAAPGILLFALIVSAIYRKKALFGPVLFTAVCLATNFFIFSSYNYFLNALEFGNPLGYSGQISLNSFFGGLQAYINNLCKYWLYLIDFTGATQIQSYILLKNFIMHDIFSHFGADYDLGLGGGYKNIKYYAYLTENFAGIGILGILVFVPALIKSLILPFKKLSPSTCTLSIFSLLYIINIFILAGAIFYTPFNIKYTVTFLVISAPICVYSYIRSNKKVYKWILIIAALFSYIYIGLNLPSRNFIELVKITYREKSLTKARAIFEKSSTDFYTENVHVYYLKKYIKRILPKGSKIAAFFSHGIKVYPLKMLDFEGYKIDFLLLEDYENYDLSKYDAVAINIFGQNSYMIKHFESRHKEYYYNSDRFPVSFVKRPVLCTYADKYDNPIDKNTKNALPVFAQCMLPDEYLTKNGFYLNYMVKDEIQTINKKDILLYLKTAD